MRFLYSCNTGWLEPQWLREKICTLAKKTAKVNRV